MAAVLNSVKEIVPDCDVQYLRRKVVRHLTNFGFLNDNANSNDGEELLAGVVLDDTELGEITQLLLDDLFQNGYKVASSSDKPVSPNRELLLTAIDVPDVDERTKSTDVGDTDAIEGISEPLNLPADPEPDVEDQEEPVDDGGMIECQCCFCESGFSSMVPCCEGHLFCNPCLTDYVKTKIQDGVKQGFLECMENDCSAPFARSVLARRLPAEILDKLDERIEAANIVQAAIDGLVRCPKCQMQFELPVNEQVLACVSCKFSSCRYCQIEWSAEHAGKRCEEIESTDATRSRRLLEEKMTEAVVRKCPKCQTPLIKNQGCNKMSCTCGGKLCYVCREPNIDYNHFCNHIQNPGEMCKKCKKCNLWADPEKIDKPKVNALEVEAKLVAEKNRIEKLVELGQLPESAIADFLASKEAKQKELLEKPGPSGVNSPATQAGRRGHRRGQRIPAHMLDAPAIAAAPAPQIPMPPILPATFNDQFMNGVPYPFYGQTVTGFPRALPNVIARLPLLPQSMQPPPGYSQPNMPYPQYVPMITPNVAPFPRMAVQNAMANLQQRHPLPNINIAPAPPYAHTSAPINPKKVEAAAHIANPAATLITAAQNGSSDRIREVVAAQGTYVLQNTRSAEGDSVLHLAVRSGSMETVRCLLDFGCKVWATNKKGDSPLHNACGLGNREMVHALLVKGAAVAAPGEYGRTPLHTTCAHGHADVVQLLIESGADVNAIDGLNGATPLHLAAYFGYDDVVTLLLNNGANFNAVDDRGNSPVDAALAAGHANLVELFFNTRSTMKENEAGSSQRQKRPPEDEPSSSSYNAPPPSSNQHKRLKKK